MESLFLIIPGALLFAFGAVLVYLWAVNSGQFDDLDKAASSILFEDEETPPPAPAPPAAAHAEDKPGEDARDDA